MRGGNVSFEKTIDAAEKPGYAARLIAYLSVAMLAAAIGSFLGAGWGRLWFIFGTFGLVSSLGLYLISQSRAKSEYLRKRNELARQAEKHLKKMVVVEESFDEISEAVRRIQTNVLGRERSIGKAKAAPRLSLDMPATITPLGWPQKKSDESFPGRLRNISGYGFGLAHDCELQRGYVLLELELADNEPIRFIADLLWCEAQEDGRYHSGGKLLELVSSVAASAS